eukprot:CAMPEP_0205931332 /NCGR_PEP_ID=MMETSP1325-20131115/27223_1 /ASSEMBLY_ACC=CAM_ASM_000708 /TAXON_ID=236786 /ORGANISM="Florenciella sp., Strain RCC1007" /LENGTH=32 /DNA_ID= /DNA_START= /DNA_END= /DNA_ORIENTATION=
MSAPVPAAEEGDSQDWKIYSDDNGYLYWYNVA